MNWTSKNWLQKNSEFFIRPLKFQNNPLLSTFNHIFTGKRLVLRLAAFQLTLATLQIPFLVSSGGVAPDVKGCRLVLLVHHTNQCFESGSAWFCIKFVIWIRIWNEDPDQGSFIFTQIYVISRIFSMIKTWSLPLFYKICLIVNILIFNLSLNLCYREAFIWPAWFRTRLAHWIRYT